jgi:hypothetical protein
LCATSRFLPVAALTVTAAFGTSQRKRRANPARCHSSRAAAGACSLGNSSHSLAMSTSFVATQHAFPRNAMEQGDKVDLDEWVFLLITLIEAISTA